MCARLLIGIITTDCQEECQSEIMRGMISQAFKSSCDVAVICPLTNFFIETTHKFNEKSIFNLIMSDVFDGFLYNRNSFLNAEVRKYIDDLCTKSKKPVMLLDYTEHNRFETTMSDDIEAVEAITDHLIDVHGYKKIYCLTGDKGTLVAEERLRGYLRSMKKHHLPVDKSYYFYGDFWSNAAIDFAQKILSGKIERPDAVVCSCDKAAVTLADTLIKGGIRVPEDIAITGFDAVNEGYRFSPSITSYQRPNYQLGVDSFRRLYRIITGKICTKVTDEPGKIRLGNSCGCVENPEFRRETKRQLKTIERFQVKMFASDMLIDISNSSDIDTLIDRIDHYTYLIYKMNQIYICLTEKFLNNVNYGSNEKLGFNSSDHVSIVYNKAAVCRNPAHGLCNSSNEVINIFRKNRNHPSAFYISPLHYNDEFFGYAAVSFGKHPIAYSKLYIQWIGYVNMALQEVRMQSVMNITLKKLDSLAIYDEITGLLSRSGFIDAFSQRLHEMQSRCKDVTYIHIELTELRNSYYKNGSLQTTSIIKAFSEWLKNNIPSEKKYICGTLSLDCYGVICFDDDKTEALYNSLKRAITDSENAISEISAFTIGSCTNSIYEQVTLPDMIYKAAINKIHTFSKNEIMVNPQFEKLCNLRNKMKKSPELQWNISDIADSMFISKSYLQKIYKSYFNKSIIEELIEFRIEKAKKLLVETNMTVTDIANECGYSTYNYFVRQFRSSEKISPTQYRENNSQM